MLSGRVPPGITEGTTLTVALGVLPSATASIGRGGAVHAGGRPAVQRSPGSPLTAFPGK